MQITEPNVRAGAHSSSRQSSEHNGEIRSGLGPAAALKAGEELFWNWEPALSPAGGRNLRSVAEVALSRCPPLSGQFLSTVGTGSPCCENSPSSDFTGQESIHMRRSFCLVGTPLRLPVHP